MIAAGVSLSEFDGYEDLKEPGNDEYDENDEYDDEYEDDEDFYDEEYDDNDNSKREPVENRVFFYDINDIHENNK